MNETYFWCQIPGNFPPCPEAEAAGLDECLPHCPDYTLADWSRRRERAATDMLDAMHDDDKEADHA